MESFPVGILTVSDKCSKGLATDTSGPALEKLLLSQGEVWTITEKQIVPDKAQIIASTVSSWCAPLERTDNIGSPSTTAGHCRLVIITGGTGVSPSDVTVEAVEPLFTKKLGALATAMVIGSLSITPFAALSQVAAGVIGQAIVLAVPGSKKGSVENVQQILSILPHAVETAGAVNGTRHLHAPSDGKPVVEHTSTNKPTIKCGCARTDEDGGVEFKPQGLSNKLSGGITGRARKSPYPMIPVSAALEKVLSSISELPPQELLLNQICPGQVLAQDVLARENVPAYPASIMDGYAMIASDGPGEFTVRTASTAGAASQEINEHNPLQSGEVVRVATGAPMPPGADAVVMIEDTELIESTTQDNEELRVRILDSANTVSGQFIRPIGYDLKAGTVVLHAGTVITTVGGEVGTLAVSGNKSFLIHPLPNIAVMSTGDEVVDVLGEEVCKNLQYGSIRDCNRPALLTALKALGCTTVDLGVIKDEPDILAQTISKALDTCQGIITTGGVSMGERDWLKPVVEQKLGGKIHFGRVAMKPSKPTTFATIPHNTESYSQEKFIFALPGNPVSALVAFHMFVAPAIRKLAGHLIRLNLSGPEQILNTLRPSVRAIFEGLDYILDRVRPEYIRGSLVWDHVLNHWIVRFTEQNQQSSRMASMRCANALISLPCGSENKPAITRGEWVNVIVIAAPEL
ncbi:hypothetical protein COEREDRAFT_41789 [Coemansia reversa NRRL 1564]|uniref:MoaB/Mog domain-containing protein n=1 Tax=Coemansia reversa (strain ATCC 12441 / NRRL 1564) TaxID=763665 RepID=A0A2G5BCR2_COERN|nr:hypothetical protein COEREDRAFT_41789 [Coemansia reversa NRRL 1564]|eukprot:PIA16796.1 hypothetical protein COEREDRAFT_41789 [Coemansia reversa NRRL 1564]